MLDERFFEEFQNTATPYILLYPLVWLFSRWVRWRKRGSKVEIEHYAWFYDRYSEPIMNVRKGAARWPALEALYNWRPDRKGIIGRLERFWMNIRSAQGLRNRKVIVAKLIREAALEKIKTEGGARILSLACGSAQSVFEAVQGLENVSVLGVDRDDTAICYSQKLAEQYGIKGASWRRGNVVRPGAVADNFKANIVEVVGLFDYLSDEMIVRLLQSIGDLAEPGAILISAHIHPNMEMGILEDIADWDMTYRDLPRFKRLISDGGIEQASYYTEPHGIFTVVRGVTSGL